MMYRVGFVNDDAVYQIRQRIRQPASLFHITAMISNEWDTVPTFNIVFNTDNSILILKIPA